MAVAVAVNGFDVEGKWTGELYLYEELLVGVRCIYGTLCSINQ